MKNVFVIMIFLFVCSTTLFSQQKILTITLSDGQVIKVTYVGYNQDNGAVKEYQVAPGQSANLTLPNGQVTKVKDVRYYHTGELEYARFFKVEPIKLQDGQLVKATEIRFFLNGNIDYIEFNHPIVLPNKQKVKVFRVKNDYNGVLDGFVLPEKVIITIPNGQKIPATFVSFYSGSDAIKDVELDSSTLIKLPDGQNVSLSSISFFEDGTIKSVKTLSSTSAEINVKLPNGVVVPSTEVTYYQGGVIEGVIFAKKTKIELAPGITPYVKILYYYNTAKVKEAVLDSKEEVHLTINNKPIVATYRIFFDEIGNITDAE